MAHPRSPVAPCVRCGRERKLNLRQFCTPCENYFYQTKCKLPEGERATYTAERFMIEHPARSASANAESGASRHGMSNGSHGLKDRLLELRAEAQHMFRHFCEMIDSVIAGLEPEEVALAPPSLPEPSGNGDESIPPPLPAPVERPHGRIDDGNGSARRQALPPPLPHTPPQPQIDYKERMRERVGADPDCSLAHAILSRVLLDAEPYMVRNTPRMRLSITLVHRIIGLEKKTRQDANAAAVKAFLLLGLSWLEPGKQPADPTEKQFHFFALKLRKMLGFKRDERFDIFVDRLARADKTGQSDQINFDELRTLFL